MFENVLVKDWMTSPVITIKSNTLLSDAHQLMKEKGVRRLIVTEGQKPLGLVTVGDVREASPSDATSLSIWEMNYLWARITVGEIMTKNLITIASETSILDAAELMLEHKVSGLPVVDRQGHLVGIITESDIFRMLVKQRKQVTS